MLEGITLYFPASALINAVTSTVLGLYILFTNFKHRTARYLIYFCFSVAAWSYGYFLWQIADNAASALFWSRALMYGAVFTSLSYFHLVTVFLEVNRQRIYRAALVIFYCASLVFIIVNYFNYNFVVGVAPVSYFKFWPQPGFLYAPYLISFGSQVLLASFLLYRKFSVSKGSVRMQAALLLIGIGIAFFGGSTNYLLWYGINVPPWGNSLVVIFVFLNVYSILKYRFLDLRVVSAELFTALFFLFLVIDAFLSRNLFEAIFRIVVLVIMVAFGVMLIRSVRREVKRREEMTVLARRLEEANIRLQELDRQKTEFLSIAAHQLRTPLSATKGFIELIEDGAYGKITGKVKNVLRDINTNNDRLVKLVDEFLDVSRIEQGRTIYNFRPADLNAITDSVVKELQARAAEQGLKINWRPEELPKVVMDEEKIRNVAMNFIDNAIKYGKDGSISVTTERKDDGVALRVRDHGIGFGKVDEINFFQKMYRGENVKGINVNGTGFGLFVCRKFAEAHGGRVWATSPGPGKGSEFGFWIPLKGNSGAEGRGTEGLKPPV